MPDGSPTELKESFDSLLSPLLLNASLAAVKLQSPLYAESAIKSTTRALNRLNLSPADKGEISGIFQLWQSLLSISSGKALYRRALARAIKKELDEAEADLVEANKAVPDDSAIIQELAKIRQIKKEKKEKEKKAFKKMFS
jgi:peptidyl-prolyl isomerase D